MPVFISSRGCSQLAPLSHTHNMTMRFQPRGRFATGSLRSLRMADDRWWKDLDALVAARSRPRWRCTTQRSPTCSKPSSSAEVPDRPSFEPA
jgi:hypothetical protein